jgi:hypothetical protein
MAVKTRSKVVSNGTRRSVRKINTRKDPSVRFANQLDAFLSGKNVVMTIPNGNPLETNKRFIKVNASQIYGDWRAMRSGLIDKTDHSKKGKRK